MISEIATLDDGFVEIFWEEDKENGFSLIGNKPFKCADLCDELQKEREAFTLLLGTFEHVGGGEIKLVGLKDKSIK